MQIMIEIPNEEVPNKQEIIDISLHFIAGEVCECSYPYIVLPKGHGRLIDADLIAKQYGLGDATKYGNKNAKQQDFSYSTMMMYEIADMIDDAPTIIEADGGDAE